MPSCDRDHSRITYTEPDCPLCAERRQRGEIDGWRILRDLGAAIFRGRGELGPEPDAQQAPPGPAAIVQPTVRLGVIIPVRDRSAALGRCLRWLGQQDAQPTEVIVVDCGSLDGEAQEAQAAEADATYLRIESERWCKGAAVRAGLDVLDDACTHVLLLDADILLHPEAVGRICAWLRTHEAVAVPPLDVELAPGALAPGGDTFARLLAVASPRGQDQVGGVVAYPLRWLRDAGGPDPAFVGWGYQDLDLWRRAQQELLSPFVAEDAEIALHVMHAPAPGREADAERNRALYEARAGGRAEVHRPGERVLQRRGLSTVAEMVARQARRLLTCSDAGPGQSAFVEGLRALGFEAITPSAALEARLAGHRVLYHGAWAPVADLATPTHGTRPVVLWHSGLTGSDLMGEGETLEETLAAARAGRIDLLWLERRDVLPAGAFGYMVPVWSPEYLSGLAEPRPEKVGDGIAVALCGEYPSPAKNLLAAAAGCAGLGELHLSAGALAGVRGRGIRAVLHGSRYVEHPVLPHAEVVRLVASMDLLVHPSSSDTWPYLVLEAVYAGTPCVLSPIVAWTARLPEWVADLCVVRPSMASGEIRRLVAHLMDSPEDRALVLEAQRAVLDDLAPVHLREAADALRAVGFPVPEVPMLPAPGPGPRDLRDEVTVFVISSGEPSLASCHRHLDVQDCLFQREDVRDVAPMWRAFQAMLDRCRTPYYVQVDADMLLEPWAVSGLYDTIRAEEDGRQGGIPCTTSGWPEEIPVRGVCQVVAWLWDDDVQRPIQGVKIYRHEVCARYPYREELSCEQGQNHAMRADGWQVRGMLLGDQDVGDGTWRRTRRTFGMHFASQTPAMAFERWQRLALKMRALPWMGWIADYPPRLEAAWLAAPKDEIAKARYLGAVAGLVGPIPTGERDVRRPNQDYRRVAAYVGEYSAGPVELTVYATSRCNFACRFGGAPCRRQSPGGVEPAGDMTPETLGSVLDLRPTIRSVCVAGFGEPLLHPRILDLLAVPLGRGLAVGLITNGSRLAPLVAGLARLGLAYVSVSVNATSPAGHNEVTGTNLWPRVVEGIRAARDAGLRVVLSWVVGKSNLDQIPNYLEFARFERASAVHLHAPLPHDDSEAGLAAFQAEALTVADAPAIDAFRAIPAARLVESWPALIDLEAEPPGRCMSPFVSIGVDAQGNITGCRRVDPPCKASGMYEWAWRGLFTSSLIAQITGDRECHSACRRCFGNWRG
jgi:MoaA/NifB/PqqE/SkfB family radical SAM enzyme